MQNMERRGDDLLERLLNFAARIGMVVDALPDTRLGRHVAESRKDSCHKLSICLKELRETHCWLQLVVKAELMPKSQLAELVDECSQLMRIIAKSIVTAMPTWREPRTHSLKHRSPKEPICYKI
jgi:23S rRNA-intervening sequence protein